MTKAKFKILFIDYWESFEEFKGTPFVIDKDNPRDYSWCDKFNDLGTIINEWCPCCESEVTLDKVFQIQECPICGKPIKPCSICDMDKVNCVECKL